MKIHKNLWTFGYFGEVKNDFVYELVVILKSCQNENVDEILIFSLAEEQSIFNATCHALIGRKND